jgi:FG-GAP-like repeat
MIGRLHRAPAKRSRLPACCVHSSHKCQEWWRLSFQLVADFNDDQKDDVAVINKDDSTISIFLGKGDGTFAAPVSYASGPAPVALVTGDFNHDGKADLATSNSNRFPVAGSPSLSVLLNKNDGTLQPKVDYVGVGGNSIAMGDLNGDGNPDFVTMSPDNPVVSVLLGSSTEALLSQALW